jgi:hypothetical protein
MLTWTLSTRNGVISGTRFFCPVAIHLKVGRVAVSAYALVVVFRDLIPPTQYRRVTPV